MINTGQEQVQRIKDSCDLQTLEKYLPYLLNFNYNPKNHSQYDEDQLKGIVDLLQMSVEYYTYSNNYLKSGLISVEKQIKAIDKQNKHDQKAVIKSTEELKKSKNFLRLKKKALEKYKDFMEKESRFKCQMCDKFFSSEQYVKDHVNRRHSENQTTQNQELLNQQNSIINMIQQLQGQILNISNQVQQVYAQSLQPKQEEKIENVNIAKIKDQDINNNQYLEQLQQINKIQIQQKQIKSLIDNIQNKSTKFCCGEIELEVDKQTNLKNDSQVDEEINITDHIENSVNLQSQDKATLSENNINKLLEKQKKYNTAINEKYQNNTVKDQDIDSFLESLDPEVDEQFFSSQNKLNGKKQSKTNIIQEQTYFQKKNTSPQQDKPLSKNASFKINKTRDSDQKDNDYGIQQVLTEIPKKQENNINDNKNETENQDQSTIKTKDLTINTSQQNNNYLKKPDKSPSVYKKFDGEKSNVSSDFDIDLIP